MGEIRPAKALLSSGQCPRLAVNVSDRLAASLRGSLTNCFYYINQQAMKGAYNHRRYCTAACAVLFALQSGSIEARSIYRWVDQQGQVHFSDHAPHSESTASEIKQPAASRNNSNGLRPAETELLQQIQQRAKQQQQLAQASRRKASQELAEQEKRCNTSREKFQASRGHVDYRQHSRYLRTHCW